MRNFLLAAALALSALEAVGQGSPKLQLSQLPDGTLSSNVYVNDALGLSYKFPSGWVATPDPKGPTKIDWRGPDKAANRCSKVLLRLEPVSKTEGRFFPTAILFAIDPECLGIKAFPRSIEDTKGITEVAVKIGKTYNYTPFMSPYGNAVHPFSTNGRVIIQATGGLVVNAFEAVGGHPAKTKEPLDVNTSFMFTEAGNCWVAWAYLADEHSAEALKNVEVTFKAAPRTESR